MAEDLVAKVVYIGPSAVNVKMVHGLAITPTSMSPEGRAFVDASNRGNFTEAAEIGLQRTLDKYRGVLSRENTNDAKAFKFCVSNGACLEPIINDGDTAALDIIEPKTRQLVAFTVRGYPPDFMFLKVWLYDIYPGDVVIPEFGAVQPKRIYGVLQTNPLIICFVAACDIVSWRSVPIIIRPDQSIWEVDDFPISDEQHKAIRIALGDTQ